MQVTSIGADPGAVTVSRTRPVGSSPEHTEPAVSRKLIVIGASTGGIHALNTFFETLPRRIGVPILVTQHLPVPFMPVFARQLGIAAKRETLVAEEGMAACAETVAALRELPGLAAGAR